MRYPQPFLGLILLLASPLVWAQPAPPSAPAVVITEIMYHSPNLGADDLEFIELRNPSALNERSLNGLHFTNGIEFTFPDGILLEPHGFVLIAKDSIAFENFYGVPAYQWANSSLPDFGGTIVLKSYVNQVVDSVSYDDNILWPQQAAGNGASLVLCNDTLDNSGPTNWTAAATNTGLQVNGVPIFANPNADCSAANSIRSSDVEILRIAPNPSEGHFLLNFPSALRGKACELTIMNVEGRSVYSNWLISTPFQQHFSVNLPNGMYVLSINDGYHSLRQRLVIVK